MHIVDAAVHPLTVRQEDLRLYMSEPWRSNAYIPPVERYDFIPPNGGYLPELVSDIRYLGKSFRDPQSETSRVLGKAGALESKADAMPGSDPEIAARYLVDKGVDVAILVPKTRGIISDVNLGAVVCSAMNDWLAATWLTQWNQAGRYRGSIRIDPRDPHAAIAEIERWSTNPKMVQVAVPLESASLYGRKEYEEIWRTAAKHGLPLAVMAEGNFGMEGIRYFVELSLLGPLNIYEHLISLLVEGVLERVPDLKLVFVDGGYDMLYPLFWRTNKDWYGTRVETPWVKKLPTSYFEGRIYFCMNPLEAGPTDPAAQASWWEISNGANTVMYASRFPGWTYVDPQTASESVPEALRVRVMGGNASALYGLQPKSLSKAN